MQSEWGKLWNALDDMTRAACKHALELNEMHEEIARLRELCSCAYQAMGVLDAPENWLDALSNAACGKPFETESLLPYTVYTRAKGLAHTDDE